MSEPQVRGRRPWAPGLAVLASYQRAWLRGDLIAGVTMAAYLIPQVMAYSEIMGLPPVSGLWAVMAPIVIYAILGSSRQLSVGPESTTALMTAASIALVAGPVSGPQRLAVAALIAVAVGLLCILAFVARLGFIANLLSKPILVGYLGALGILMIISQFGRITQLTITGDGPWAETASVIAQLGSAHLPTVVMSLAVAAALFALRAWLPTWPGPLLVMLTAAALVAWTPLSTMGLAVIGQIPTQVPAFVLPSLNGVDLGQLGLAALGIAIVGYSDVILTGRAFAAKREEHIDANGELLAMGAANLTNGLFGSFAVSSSASRTVIGDAAGSRTQLYSIAAGVTVLVTLFAFGPVLAAFPQAALSGVVIYAGVRLIDLGELRRIARFRRSELVLALITALAVLFLGLLPGIGVAVGLSLLDVIRRIVHPHDGILGYVPGLAGMHDIDDYPGAIQVPGLVVYRYDSPLFFANAEDFRTRALAAVHEAEPAAEWFVLNAEANTEVDLTAVDMLEELRRRVTEAGVVFAMARVKWEVREQLAQTGFVDEVGVEHIFATLPTAVAGYAQWHKERYGYRPPGVPEATLQPPPTDS
ncbi:MAG: STAS domain-containing protein [Propionicimonas sp.]